MFTYLVLLSEKIISGTSSKTICGIGNVVSYSSVQDFLVKSPQSLYPMLIKAVTSCSTHKIDQQETDG